MTYSLNDIALVPAVISEIQHRSECNPYNADQMLPLFTAPMNSVINEHNYGIFNNNKINTIIPRGVDYQTRVNLATKTFVAVSLAEFQQLIMDLSALNDSYTETRYVCIDIANGHMKQLLDMCLDAKEQFGERLILMAGNIANPKTYVQYSKAGIDFIRIGIGGGSVCTTSAKVGHHYGMASLIKACADEKWAIEKVISDSQKLNIACPYKTVPFIVADGGFDSLDKIIKALALGADFVMLGKLFAQCEEACGEVVSTLTGKNRLYYGMSTSKAQTELGVTIPKAAEGIELSVPIISTISSFCEEFISSLRSSMSYSNARTLEEFKNTAYQIQSLTEYNVYYK